jgi:hypothetical protein
VHARPDLDAEPPDGRADRARRPDAARGTVERRENSVARRIQLAAAVTVELRTQRRSPRSVAFLVLSTMSVKSTVASTRSISAAWRTPVRNSSTTSRMPSAS